MEITNNSGFREQYLSLSTPDRFKMRSRFINKWDLMDQYHFIKKMRGNSQLKDSELKDVKKYFYERK